MTKQRVNWVTRTLEIEVPTYSEESFEDSSLPSSLESLKRSWKFFATPSKEELVTIDGCYYFCKLVKAERHSVIVHVDNARGQTEKIILSRDYKTGEVGRALTWDSNPFGKAAKLFFKRQLEKLEKTIIKASKKPIKVQSIFWEAFEAVKESQTR